jgi:hypothetical protein
MPEGPVIDMAQNYQEKNFKNGSNPTMFFQKLFENLKRF